jgi:hypothetical protein
MYLDPGKDGLLFAYELSAEDVSELAWSIWEALVCVGLGVGRLVVFREWINKKAGGLMSAITQAQYGAYIIHVLIVIGVQAGLADLRLAPFVKFGIAMIVGTVI